MPFVLDLEAGLQSMVLAEDLEDVVAAGVTDGDNGIVPRRPGDGETAVRLANVMRAQLIYTHDAPTVRQVEPAVGAAVPTAGGVTMLVQGTDFGFTQSARLVQTSSIPDFLQVHFAIPSNAAAAVVVYGRECEWVACSNATRVSHELMECTLPEGAGERVAVRVIAAGLAGETDAMVSYDAPVVTGMALHGFSDAFLEAMADPSRLGLVVSTTNPEQADPTGILRAVAAFDDLMLETHVPNATTRRHIGPAVLYADSTNTPAQLQIQGAPTRGGRPGLLAGDLEHPAAAHITVYGRNLGRSGAIGDPKLCVFAAWTNRDSAAAFDCDGMESFPGEGEVPAWAIVAHTHDRITFELPEGAG